MPGSHHLLPDLTPRASTFVSMLLWAWLWGVVGALMAVPILMTLKIFCDHIASLAAVGEFVSGKSTKVADTDGTPLA